MPWWLTFLIVHLSLCSLAGLASCSAFLADFRVSANNSPESIERDARLIEGDVGIGERIGFFFIHFFGGLVAPRIVVYSAIGGTLVWGIAKLF